jgi:polysaccharide biosynthesis protein PslG
VAGCTEQTNGARGRIVAAASLVLVLALAALAPRASAAVPRGFFGVVPQTAVTPEELDRMAANGVATVRVLFSMPEIEPAQDEFVWANTDQLVANAAARGIRVIPTLYGSTAWLNVLDGDAGCGGGCAPNSDLARDAWADFARALVDRYGPTGEFWKPPPYCPLPLVCETKGDAPCACASALPIRTWQIWNEQNSPKYFHPGPNPARYAKLLAAAGAAIHARDPNAEVVTGGMWGPPGADEVTPTARFVRKLYAASGRSPAFDAIAVHPYAASLSGVAEQVEDVVNEIRRARDDAGIWVTELGWASGGPRDNGLVKTPKAQARLLTTSIDRLISKRRAWRIRGVQWYAWRDAPPNRTDCEWCPKSGLRGVNGAAKPAARAFKRLVLARRG